MLFIVTGGTIDKQPVYLPDGTFDNNSKVFEQTHIPEMLKKARFHEAHSIQTLFMVDSLDMNDALRAKVATAIAESPQAKVIVTHGTDTMPETGRFLAADSRLTTKTIVLTGAMLPYSVGESSDALFNLGNAIAYADSLPAGVYVAMNGKAFEAANVRKDREAGLFMTIR
jgi:L-asparaginase